MHPRFSIPRFACPKILSDSTKFLSENTNRLAEKCRPATDYLAQRPRKLVLGAATATVAVAGIGAAAATTGPGPANGAIGTPGSVSYSGAVHAANHKAGRASLASDHGAHQRTVSQHAPKHAPSKHAPSKHAPSKHSAAPESKHAARQHTVSHHATVHHSAAHHTAHHVSHRHTATARTPYLIYDSTTPSAIPAHRDAAVYATGSYAASPSEVTGRNKVLWIDTTGGDQHASVLDVEPGDATPAGAADWARNRLATDPHAVARLYTFRNEWPAVQAAVHTLPQQMQSRIRWWIADPTGVPHIVPGAAATQWYWGSSYDITTASSRF